jgi:hypothetical protein
MIAAPLKCHRGRRLAGPRKPRTAIHGLTFHESRYLSRLIDAIETCRYAGAFSRPFEDSAMPMDINIQLSDDDLQFFVKGMRDVQASVKDEDADTIIAAAQKLLDETRGASPPPFIAERIGSVESLISMSRDVGFNLPAEDRKRVLAALAYLADPNDAIPDNVPVLGFLDDAIMIELCRQDLRFEIEAYDDFCEWRTDEARARGLDPEKLMVQRADWADAQAAEAIALMQRRRRDSYSSGAWKPTLFKIS